MRGLSLAGAAVRCSRYWAGAAPADAGRGGRRVAVAGGIGALDAGAVDAGVETLRRAAAEAGRAADPAIQAEVLRALGSALVHAVRGSDGEGAVVLHRALVAARTADRPALVADILRELAFVDVQAGRYASADRSLREAAPHAWGDPALLAGILAIRGMNRADRGRRGRRRKRTVSADAARAAGRQQGSVVAGCAGPLLLVARQGPRPAGRRAEHGGGASERWSAFPLAPGAACSCLAPVGRWHEAGEDAEHAFALACELGDPCWEGMAARALGLLALDAGDLGAAQAWLADARRRCDRVPDRYVWVSGYVGLAQLETAARHDPGLVAPPRPSYRVAARSDCRSSWPGRWCTRPSLATMPGSRWRVARLTASPTTIAARVQALPAGEPYRRITCTSG